jgi:ZIP family zinc transporter
VEALELAGLAWTATGFIISSLSILVLDSLFPHMHFGMKEKSLVNVKLLKYSTLITVGISLHNFPEGVALGSSYVISARTWFDCSCGYSYPQHP